MKTNSIYLLFTRQPQLLIQRAKAARGIVVHALHNWHGVHGPCALADQLFGLFEHLHTGVQAAWEV
jgi:hypothetical protein